MIGGDGEVRGTGRDLGRAQQNELLGAQISGSKVAL